MVWRETWWPCFFFGSSWIMSDALTGIFGGDGSKLQFIFWSGVSSGGFTQLFLEGRIPKKSNHLVIQSEISGMVKWPFQGVKWPPTRGWKGHFESPSICCWNWCFSSGVTNAKLPSWSLPSQDSTQACLSCNWPCGRKARETFKPAAFKLRACGFPDMGTLQVLFDGSDIFGEFSHRLDVSNKLCKLMGDLHRFTISTGARFLPSTVFERCCLCYSPPKQTNGWNLKINDFERKSIWTKPSWIWVPMFVCQGVDSWVVATQKPAWDRLANMCSSGLKPVSRNRKNKFQEASKLNKKILDVWVSWHRKPWLSLRAIELRPEKLCGGDWVR